MQGNGQTSYAMLYKRRRGGWRGPLLALAIPLALIGAAIALYSAATSPPRVVGRGPQRAFDPVTTGRLEQRAWAYYYWRQWPALFDVLLRLSRSQFNLSLPQAIYASYLATRAQVVFAQQGDRDGVAQEYMRRFYDFVREPVGGRYDPARAAELELAWWVVHRQREQYPDRTALARALAASYAEVYQAPAERMTAAADARALAMDLSDQWNREGKDAESPLLGQIADLLITSYQALRDSSS